ncbi:MAG: protein-glutamate O-methyltransferase CheR [Deltaproteobacteria bacterium]|nr:protein-glutamate O-methyltransferase CheR [Deltaproteobacteria bacterium]
MLTKNTFFQLRDFIYEKTGIYFPENKMYLIENRLGNRLKELGLSSFEEYYLYLKYGNEKSKKELPNLYDAITTNETSFFRNPQQFDAFRTILIKEYIQNDFGISSCLRIWSTGCSTGEEPYTIAIVVLELMETLKRDINFTVYATDISPKVLKSAKRGVYSEYTMRGVPDHIKKKYFVPTGNNSYKISEDLKKYVRFDFMNLVDERAYALYKNMDVIFCRNVLIYLHEKAKKKVLENLYGCLKSGGFLILGYAETLHQQRYGFRPVLFPGTVVYQKV